MLAATLGVAGPNPTPGFTPTAPVLFDVQRTNDRPAGPAQASVPVQFAMRNDFAPAFDYATERYLEDIAPENPNAAPVEFWPSTCHFRSVLYRAGKRLGADAAVYLERIPDRDVRLFAQIELAAALAGLPEIQSVQRGYRPGPPRPSSPRKGL